MKKSRLLLLPKSTVENSAAQQYAQMMRSAAQQGALNTDRQQVERLLQEQRDHVRVLLAENRHLVAGLRDALLERHELIGREITDVLEGAVPEPVPA